LSDALGALLADARRVTAVDRAALADELFRGVPTGCLLLETCHRVELYGSINTIESLSRAAARSGVASVRGGEAVQHLLRVAVGRESAVVAEDQLLHQLRLAATRSRANGPLPAELDRLIDIALRAGRRARSWLPAKRPSLAEVALQRMTPRADGDLGAALVVGAGDMARRGARALQARGARLLIANRTPERAAALAAVVDGRAVPFDPGHDTVGAMDGVLIALAGRWPVSDETAAALANGEAWIIDLSAPSALPPGLVALLGRRLLTIDDLAPEPEAVRASGALGARLDRLIEQALAEYGAWEAAAGQREAAHALSARAVAARQAELDELWRRVPQLESKQRAEVERMARQLTERLLRDPLERLQQDGDGSQLRAARALFRL